MDTYFNANILTGTGLLAPDVNHKKIRAFLQEQIKPVRELMAYYQCAMMEVETKFKVLSQELSLEYDRNPIETIKTRLKSMDSITDKLLDRGFSLTLENIEQQLNDVAGVRVICGLPSDIYEMADAFLRQDDVRLIMKKDYIANPKENGYRSLHLIVEIPIFLHDEKNDEGRGTAADHFYGLVGQPGTQNQIQEGYRRGKKCGQRASHLCRDSSRTGHANGAATKVHQRNSNSRISF